MSQRNGDRARFNRVRKRKLLLRKNVRELLKAMTGDGPATENAAARESDSEGSLRTEFVVEANARE